MLLVDIGNTSIHFGIENKGKIIKSFRVYNKNLTLRRLKEIAKEYASCGIIVCSVVPSLTKRFQRLNRPVYVTGKDIKIPIKCFYNKNEIGQDRLVNAFAAKILYPQTKIIIDFGTAITIDFLSSNGGYLGGIILPGINLYLKALGTCELLPVLPDNIKLRAVSSFIPKNTKTSISKGLNEGFPFMINGLIGKYSHCFEKRQGKKTKIIVTGGESKILKKMLNFRYIYAPDLTLNGLILLRRFSGKR